MANFDKTQKMKKWIRLELLVIAFTLIVSILESCKENKAVVSDELALNNENKVTTLPSKTPISKAFKDYWYAGEAEITSYELKQARYGEIREGKAVLIYVTEPFLPGKQVKADGNNPDNVSVLKLNATKNYLTGIYPYSIMSSTFYPVHDNQHAIKTSLSVQEWCGHVYTQLNNRDEFEYTAHSYFESEADETNMLPKAHLENEIWNKIRINPQGLPIGTLKMIPSLEFFRTKHLDVKAFQATASLNSDNGISTYTINYNDVKRKLTINFSEQFPHEIQGWTETFQSGYGANTKTMISSAKKLKRINTAYWGQNSNKYLHLRDSLSL
jgi:hypothetical protein